MFIITYDPEFKDVTYQRATPNLAVNLEKKLPEEYSVLAIRDADSLRSVPVKVALQISNEIAGTSAKKISTGRKEFNDRLFALLDRLPNGDASNETSAPIAEKPRRVSKALKNAMTAPASHEAEQKPKTPKKPSYQDILRQLFQDNPVRTRAEVIEALGCDEKNASVAVSILKNAKRTKEPMQVAYDRKTKTYTATIA